MDPFFMIAAIVAIVGTIYASYSDLKTTEVSDWVPISMAVTGVVINGVHSIVAWDYTYILYSVITGLAFLTYGIIIYKLGQWGGADAAILAALGALIPIYPAYTSYFGLPIPFPIALVLNVYLLGAVYSLFYALVLAFRQKRVFRIFANDLKDNWKRISLYFISLVAAIATMSFSFSYAVGDMGLFYSSLARQSMMLPLFVFILVYWRFAKVVEQHIFKWKVHTRNLKIGDMIAEDIVLPNQTLKSKLLEGLTEDQVRMIRKHKKYVTIKEGVRFIPAFLFGLIFTLIMPFI